MTPEEQFQKEKAEAIAKTVTGVAESIMNISKSIPKRKFFSKETKYNRRINRSKRRQALPQMSIVAAMGAAEIAQIAAQPIPRYPKGGVTYPITI